MPDKETLERVRRDRREGKSPSTQAGEFIREEIEHVRQGKHGVRSTKQAIAIGLSQARRAGVKLPAPGKGQASPETIRQARQDRRKGARRSRRVSAKRSRARQVARRRSAAVRSRSARKAARTRRRNRS
jgi:hypothetical protein